MREINLIAQDSSHYGRDRDDGENLARLLRGLNDVEALDWIRVHYLYPNTITQELIETMAELPRVVKYVDLPLQHADTGVLKAMRRGGTAEAHLKLLDRFRAAMPDVALRTTFIVGFPGETDEAFEHLLAFVDSARFEHVGVFTYSHEQNTPAESLVDDVPEEIKLERQERLMERQREIVLEHHAAKLGREVDVICEGVHDDTELLLVGRMPTQAPDVDGQILLNDGQAEPGELVRVELTEVAGYDLVGRIISSLDGQETS